MFLVQHPLGHCYECFAFVMLHTTHRIRKLLGPYLKFNLNTVYVNPLNSLLKDSEDLNSYIEYNVESLNVLTINFSNSNKLSWDNKKFYEMNRVIPKKMLTYKAQITRF